MGRIFRAVEKAEKEKREKPIKDVPVKTATEQIVEPKREETPPPQREDRLEVKRPLIQEERPLLSAPPDSFAADQFRRLKTQIFHWAPNPLRTVLVTSSVPDEGKSIVAFNLATAISQEIHRKAILVDADLRKPSIYLKSQGGVKGLSNYLLDGTLLTEILIRHEENFWVVPAGPSSRQSSELIDTKKMVEFISSLRKFGDESFIIIDSPPLLLSTDPVLLSKMVDGIVMVIMADRTPKESVRRAIQSIDRNKIIGIVLNQIEKESLSYYTKYYDKYYHKQDPSKLGRRGRNQM
jgi:protein-tyrosine kinase